MNKKKNDMCIIINRLIMLTLVPELVADSDPPPCQYVH